MINQELLHILSDLRALPAENEVVEFKEAKNNFDFTMLGKYFSALSNEANLKNKPFAWLVFGIEDKRHRIVGSNYRLSRSELDSLKGEIANKTTSRITFIEIFEITELSDGRVLMFQVPAAPKGMPVSFEGHFYGRDGEQLVPLNIEEIERIRAQGRTDDWSISIVNDATIADLDEEAIAKARENFKNKFPDKAGEVDGWDDIKFLNKAKITIKGKITRTAILLLGKEEAEHFISPADPKIRWVLKDRDNVEKDYAIVPCPLLLAVDKIYLLIRNLKYRYMKDGTLFPDEIDQYEPYIIREAINNCIAHQDYNKGGRINVIEMENDQLIFTNLGAFIPGSVEKVIEQDAPEEFYRNKFLVTAMFNLNMVDTVGGGIKKMFNFQRNRLFPLPEYDFSDGKVKVTIIGKILDIDYARLLAKAPDLSLADIILLDKVQKGKKLTEDEEKYLRSRKLIEGRKPNFFIAKQIAQSTGQKAEYSKNKAFDKEMYCEWILKSIKDNESMGRKDINKLLWNNLPAWMEDKQRKIKINNLLSELRRKKKIVNKGTLSNPEWVLNKDLLKIY